MTACEDIFEVDLTGKTVEIIAPSDGAQLQEGEITFLWREVEGARTYHLRILRDLSGGGVGAVLDTLLHNDSVSIKTLCRARLEEGTYRWSIAAMNGAYRTAETEHTLHIAEAEQKE
jgi:hypothetical protein